MVSPTFLKLLHKYSDLYKKMMFTNSIKHLTLFIVALIVHSSLITVQSFQHRVFSNGRNKNILGISSIQPHSTRLANRDRFSHMTISFSTNNNDNEMQSENLNSFRSLMGTLYGIAGIAHAFDCLIGPSQLLIQAGISPYYDLSPTGQIFALVWCLAGPLAFFLSRKGGSIADVGLVTYGVVEVGVASFSPMVGNAILVQVVVLVSWLYSRNRDEGLKV